MAAGRMRPACCELETCGLYFTLAYGGFSPLVRILNILYPPAQHVKTHAHVFMVTANDNKLSKLPFFFPLNINNIKTIFQTRPCQVLSFMLHAKSLAGPGV